MDISPIAMISFFLFALYACHSHRLSLPCIDYHAQIGYDNEGLECCYGKKTQLCI